MRHRRDLTWFGHSCDHIDRIGLVCNWFAFRLLSQHLTILTIEEVPVQNHRSRTSRVGDRQTRLDYIEIDSQSLAKRFGDFTRHSSEMSSQHTIESYNWSELIKQQPRELILVGPKIDKQIESEDGLSELVYRIQTLNFFEVTKAQNLTTLSPKIGQLVNLTNLVLHSNQLVSLPDEISSLSKLKFLDVSRNRLTALPDSISQLLSLQSLNAEHNQLTSVPDLSHLKNLLIIKLSGNQLTAFPSSLCADGLLQHLSEIHANNNQIGDIPPTISKLSTLKLLDLSHNMIQEVPGQLGDCHKLKDINLKNNKIKDRRLTKLIDQCHTKQIMDYIRSSCPRNLKPQTLESGDQLVETGNKNTRESSQDRRVKAKDARRRRRSSSRSPRESESDKQLDYIHVIGVQNDEWFKAIASPAILELRKIVVCLVRGVDLTPEGLLKRFITLQTGLHSGICGQRQHATIATHDMGKINGRAIHFDVKPPSRIKLVPLNRQKEMSALELYKQLNEEAEAYRKEKKRQTYSGIHKYLYLLKGKQRFPVVLDDQQKVISLPPLINSETTKITEETKDILLEVSGESVPTCRKVMDALLHGMLKLGLCRSPIVNSEKNNSEAAEETPFLKRLSVEPVKVVDLEGKLYVQYPSRTDLQFEDIDVKREK